MPLNSKPKEEPSNEYQPDAFQDSLVESNHNEPPHPKVLKLMNSI